MMENRNNRWPAAFRTFRNTGLMALAVFLLVAFTGEPAHAWGKKKPVEKEARKAINMHQHPDYHLFRGVLRQDHLGNWSLDQRAMFFNRNSRVTPEDGPDGDPVLVEGRTALVTAAEINGELIVRRVTMVPVDELVKRGGYNVGTKTEDPPAMDPDTPR